MRKRFILALMGVMAVGGVMSGAGIAKTSGTDEGSRAIGPGDGSDNYGSLTLGDDMMVTSVRVEPCDHADGFTYTNDGCTENHHHTSHCPYCLHSETHKHSFENNVCSVCGVTQCNELEAIEEVQGDNVQSTKVIENGVLYLKYKGTKYYIQGNIVK